MNRPPSGSMVYWRFKKNIPCAYVFGYVTYVSGPTLIRMGLYNGDSTGGSIVDSTEIEWKELNK